MNKQEALESILAVCRRWEAPHEEVRATDPRVVARELQVSAADLAEDMGTDDAEAYLLTIAAAALYLLVDEVTVVAGRSLDEWLADPANQKGMETVRKLGGALLAAGFTGGPVNGGQVVDPRPINGVIGGRLDA